MSNYIEQPEGGQPKMKSRMDDLVGKNYRILAFRDLPVAHQLGIAHYLAVDTDGWSALHDADSLDLTNPIHALQASLHEYVHVYGDELFGVIDLPAQAVKEAVMADEDRADGNASWEDYTAAYCAGGDVPQYGHDNRWPVILSNDNYETLWDGWHRFHSYMRSGCTDIPAVFFPAERHVKLDNAKSAVAPAPIGAQGDCPNPGM